MTEPEGEIVLKPCPISREWLDKITSIRDEMKTAFWDHTKWRAAARFDQFITDAEHALAAWNRRAGEDVGRALQSGEEAMDAARKISKAVESMKGKPLAIAFKDDATAEMVRMVIENAGQVARALLSLGERETEE